MKLYRSSLYLFLAATAISLSSLPAASYAQQRAPEPPPARGMQGPQVVSPEVLPDRRVTFRILAPKAQEVRLTASDIPALAASGRGGGPSNQLTRNADGVWEITVGPIDPGAYRYNFNVDGVAVIDPRNPSVSESNNNVWSLVYIPGTEWMDTRPVPHGTVSEVTYYSTTLKRFRRMHVYTPPGYELGTGRYPVFYLLHGAGDCDDSWSSVGRAGFILDNLIAAKKARPMIVVMPAGHTTTGPMRGGATFGGTDPFVSEFSADIMPHIEKNYRVLVGRNNRAIAGLSMGGNHTLNIAIPNLDKFAYIGVFSSGLIGRFPTGRGGAAPAAPSGPTWEEQHKAALENAALKKGLRLFWFATGVDDFLINTTRSTVDLFKKFGFNPVLKETPGAHTWIVWRQYLNEFAPQLFQ